MQPSLFLFSFFQFLMLRCSRLYACVSQAVLWLHIWRPVALGLVGAVLIAAPTSWAQDQKPAATPNPYGTGFIEAAQWNPTDQTLTVSGWVAPQAETVFVTSLQIRVGDQPIYQGRFERYERPDVVEHTGRDAWLWSGFKVQISIPKSVTGNQLAITAKGRLGSGHVFDLQTSPSVAALSITAPNSPQRTAKVVLMLALLLPLMVWCWGAYQQWGREPISTPAQQHSARWFAASVLLSFGLLVAGGWTGSSIGLLFKNNPLVTQDAKPWLGADLPVRSDEWAVLTPLIWAQHQHEPRYPVRNQHIGAQGQNMMVVGMTGVPVAHVSSLAKPATWGFFMGDMPRGLAWHWWFPFFAAFAALCAVLVRFFGLQWPLASALTLTLTASGYAVGWSGWAMYALFFALSGVLSVGLLVQARSHRRAISGGIWLGWSIAGFALVLYPAWQISFAYVVLPWLFTWLVVWAWRQHTTTKWSWWHKTTSLTGWAVGALTALVLLGAWWVDAHDAVQAMRDTIYPGGRSTEAGGDIDRWFLLKGWLSPLSMYINQSSLIVPSDAASVVFVLPALLVAVVRQWWLDRRFNATSVALVLSGSFIAIFMWLGLPQAVARWSLIGFATTYRMDAALGLVQVLLWAWLLSSQGITSQRLASRPTANLRSLQIWPIASIACAALSVLIALWTWMQVQWLPVAIGQWIPQGFVFLCCAAVAAASFAIMQGHHRTALAVVLVWTLSATIGFNPLSKAVAHVDMQSPLKQLITPHDKLAVVGPTEWAMALQASGTNVIGGVYYYPQNALWQALDPSGQHRSTYNRYHRLQFAFQAFPAPQKPYQLVTPRLDEVRLILDPARFDFGLLDASMLIAPAQQSPQLNANPSLRAVKIQPPWALYYVQSKSTALALGYF